MGATQDPNRFITVRIHNCGQCPHYIGGFLSEPSFCGYGDRAKVAYPAEFKVSQDGIADHCPILNTKPAEDQEIIGTAEVREAVTHDCGHPWTGAKGWDLLEMQADSEEQLSEAIANAERKFWHVWIRDDLGGKKAVMYRPTNAEGEWEDRCGEARYDQLEEAVLAYGCPHPILNELLNRKFDEGYGCGSNASAR